jgi:tetratricopeptide (TPR) repeat protein
MNWAPSQIITTAISVAALCLGILNFVLARRADRIRNELQKRNDQLEIGRLLDKAWDALHGTDGFTRTSNTAKLQEAESNVRQALLLDSTHARAIRYEGYVLEEQGNPAAARGKYKQALARNPRDAAAHNSLGLVQQGEDALASFRRSIACDPSYALAYNNMAKVLEGMGRMDEAETQGLKAIELQPRNVAFLLWLARHYRKRSRTEAARDYYERAISADPNEVDALTELGALIHVSGDVVEGLGLIEQAMRTDPKDAYPHVVLAALHADLGEPEEALRHYQKAAQIDPKQRLRGATVQELARDMRELLSSRKISSQALLTAEAAPASTETRPDPRDTPLTLADPQAQAGRTPGDDPA